MTGLPIPGGSSSLTADWLESALDAGASGCRLQEFSLELLDAGEMAEVVRCRLIWTNRTAEAAMPESVVVKLPSPNSKTRRIAKRMGWYRRECAFYKTLRKDTPIRSPAMLYGDYEAKSGRFVLVLEDLGDMEAVDQVAGADATQAKRAIQAAAKLHGRFWNRVDRPPLSDFHSDILHPMLYRPVMCMAFLASYARALERFGGALPEDRLRPAEAYGPKITDFIKYGTVGPRTFTHSDFRIDNLLFSRNGNDVAAIDWQASKLGSGLFDVAYFLVGSVPVEVRRATERDILEEYHGIVCRIGGESTKGFMPEDCWRLYRRYVVVSFIVNAMLLGRLPISDAREHRLAEVLLKRSLAAAEDLEAEGFLPSSSRRRIFANVFSSLCRSSCRIFAKLR